VAWFVARLLRKRSRGRSGDGALARAAEIGAGAVTRVMLPVVALIIVVLGWLVMTESLHMPAPMLRLSITLLGSFVMIRLIVYLLRRSFRWTDTLVWVERLVAIVVWSGVALYLVDLWAPLMKSLDAVSFPVGKTKISLLDLTSAVLSVLFAVVIALWIGSLIESRLLKAQGIDRSSQVVLSRIVKAVLVTIAVLVGFTAVGFDLTLLSVFGGALGVGLGFGLQKTASNYVSGFIILLDKSLRLGDMIAMDKYYGTVTEIKTRYTVVKALDGTEAIVPNEMLVTNPVTNYSFTDRSIWLTTRVQIAYSSDVERVMAMLENAARSHPRVIKSPGPRAYLSSFGADGIDLTLGFWIRDPEEGRMNITSDINLAIWRAFQANNVVIPFPQREIRVQMPSAPPERPDTNPPSN
ncbi:MAG TPA: mechanosensitive ion channel domain-containing protein, partial [Burkholderiaceae bacterium]|nr:mechanosensitive ion channel domain-containing protein [Burkholderiaceae bacterium]